MKKLNKKGFTLIELLAVIIILGILMVIAVPAVSRYITESRKKAFITDMSSAVEAVRIDANSGKFDARMSVGSCYMLISDVSLEKGSFSADDYGNSYILVERNADTGYSYTLFAWNKTYGLNGKGEAVTGVTDFTDINIDDVRTSEFTIDAPTTPTGITTCVAHE